MPKYQIPVFHTVRSTYEVEAETLLEAIEAIENKNLSPIDVSNEEDTEEFDSEMNLCDGVPIPKAIFLMAHEESYTTIDVT